MIRRVLSLSIVAVLAIPAHAQDAVPRIPTPPSAPSTASATAEVPATALATTSNSETSLAGRVLALEKQVALLQEKNTELIKIATNNSTMLRDVVTARATPEGGERFVPNVQAIRDDRDARRLLVDTVVHDMTRNTGELRLRNDMSTGQSLLINGVDTVYVPAHSVRTVPVPSGTATTELAGEGTKSWMIGAPNYSQEVIIAPAVQMKLASTGSPWQYDPLTGIWWRPLQ